MNVGSQRKEETMTTTKNSQRAQRPHDIYIVHGEGEQSRWTRIGAAWPNKKGHGFNGKIDVAPTLRVVILPPKAKNEHASAQEGGQP